MGRWEDMGSFLGIKMDQHWMDLFIWEKFLNGHDMKLLIEFGTGYGGMSTYLAAQCRQRNIQFMTFDNVQSLPQGSPIVNLLGVREAYNCKDIFSDEVLNLVVGSMGLYGHPTCMFFDDGDKPREWRTFAPHAAVGDYLVVHDWETEFKASDAVGAVTRIYQSEQPVRDAYKTAWFRKDG